MTALDEARALVAKSVPVPKIRVTSRNQRWVIESGAIVAIVCRSCDVQKPLVDFPPSTKNKSKRGGVCRPCVLTHNRSKKAAEPEKHRERGRQARDRNRDANRSSRMLSRYGITLAEYDRMLQSQGGVCAICCHPETAKHGETIATLCIDHCHATGRVRGLLCRKCNGVLGLATDSQAKLLAAMRYLLRQQLIEARALLSKPHIEWRAFEDGWRARQLLAEIVALVDGGVLEACL